VRLFVYVDTILDFNVYCVNLSSEFFNYLKVPCSSNRKKLEPLVSYANMIDNISKVLGIQARFSTSKPLFSISFDPIKQTYCMPKHIFSKTNIFSLKNVGDTHDKDSKKAGKTQ